MIYFASDYHFFHKNIIQYCKRPFRDVVHMNSVLMTAWNRTVEEDDLVIYCGDFLFGDKRRLEPVLQRLKGKKILVVGNHDDKEVLRSPSWHAVHKTFEFEYEGHTFHVNHYPQPYGAVLEPNTIYVHGHSHGSQGFFFRGRYDVSCENTGYTPISIDKIVSHWREHGINKA